jgi:hypothetical protein
MSGDFASPSCATCDQNGLPFGGVLQGVSWGDGWLDVMVRWLDDGEFRHGGCDEIRVDILGPFARFKERNDGWTIGTLSGSSPFVLQRRSSPEQVVCLSTMSGRFSHEYANLITQALWSERLQLLLTWLSMDVELTSFRRVPYSTVGRWVRHKAEGLR